MELEIDGRLRLQRDSASQLHQLEVAHGIFSWSTTRVFLVDALNEASQTVPIGGLKTGKVGLLHGEPS